MDLQVTEDIKSERLAELQALLNEQQLQFNQSKIGTIQPILVDRVGKHNGQLSGKTPFMQSIYFDGNQRLQGEMINVIIEKAFANSVTGTVVTYG